MDDASLRDILSRLHAELREGHEMPDDLRALLSTVSDDIDRLLAEDGPAGGGDAGAPEEDARAGGAADRPTGAPAGGGRQPAGRPARPADASAGAAARPATGDREPESLAGRLRDAAFEFEGSHPRLVAVVEEMAEALARLGL